MIASKSLKLVGKIINFLHFFRMSPFTWNENLGKLEHATKRDLKMWKLLVILHLLHISYCIFSLVERIVQQNVENRTDLALHFVYVGGFVQSISYTVKLWTDKDEFHLLLNEVVRLSRRHSVRGSHMEGMNRFKLMHWLLVGTVPCVALSVISAMFIFVLGLHSPRFFYGRVNELIGLKENDINYWLWLCFCLLFEASNYLHYFLNLAFYWVLTIFGWSITFSGWLHMLTKSRTAHPWNSGSIYDRLRSYRKVQVFSAVYNSCMADLVWPAILDGMFLGHVFCIYLVVPNQASVDIFSNIFFSFWTIAVAFFEFGFGYLQGEVHEDSKRFIVKIHREAAVFRRHARGPQVRRYMRAIAPIKIHVGSAFNFDRDTALEIVYFVSVAALNAILVF